MDIVTANELISGATLYYLGEDDWGPNIDQARIFGEDEAALRDEIVQRGNASGRLISLERENVRVVEGKVLALRLRERIRANGPTSPAQLPQEIGVYEIGRQLIAAEATRIVSHVSL
jgi:Protein of unknown function (DUF2849)